MNPNRIGQLSTAVQSPQPSSLQRLSMDPNAGQGDDLSALIGELSPEQLDQLLGTGDDKAALLQQQMARAQALRSPYQQGSSDSVPGELLGGLANGLMAMKRGHQEEATQAQQLQQADQTAQNQKLLLMLLRQKGSSAGPQMGDYSIPDTSYSYG